MTEVPVRRTPARPGASRSAPQADAAPAQNGQQQVTVEEPLERFFPGCFEILMPAISAALPHVINAFREQTRAQDGSVLETQEAMERSLTELFTMLTPVLNQVLPVLIEQIRDAGSARAAAGETVLDDETLERFLPQLLGAILPPLVSSLPPALQGVGGLLGGLFGGGREADSPVPRVVDAEVSARFLGPLLQAIVPAVTANLPQLFALITGQRGVTTRDTGVSWHDFLETNRLWDNDNIAVWTEPIDDANAVEIALQLAPHKSWWKGIEIQDDNGSTITEIGVQDSEKYASVRVDARSILDPGGYLVFKKAKLFGVHTGMYRLATGGLSEELKGKKATFYWYAD